jgi:acetylornithine/succinyldiaminopimelate/putrescine aminotransferase
LCDETGALLIFDEIQTGMGRTGRLWGYQHWGVEPDIMTLAKALASGIPIGAMVAREACARVMIAGSHGTTFGGNPFATTVGVATFTTMLEDRLPERAARVGAHLVERLRALAGGVPAIREVRGKGLLIGIDIDRAAGPVVEACRDRGLLILTAGEKILRMTPPLIVDEGDADRAVAIVGDALRQSKP